MSHSIPFGQRIPLDRVVPPVVAVGVFLVYLRTLSPTVGFIDAGELAAVATTLGIAHPTGYPLFTLVGWLFARMPIAAEHVVRLNLMAALFCAAGVFVFVHLLRFVLTKAVRDGGQLGMHDGTRFATAVLGASAGGGLLLGFSETYWAQAVAVEVYSLHVLLLSVVLMLFVKAGFEWRTSGERWWYGFAFVLGLSFANHMTTILLAPGLLYLYFSLQGWNVRSWKRIGMMAPLFILGLSVYAYLPLRASQSPAMNWGNPVDVERFMRHFSGAQYRVWIFSSTEAAGKQLRYFLNTLPSESAYVGIALAAIGAPLLWRFHRKLFIATALLFAGCVFYSINYDIHDIDSYFLLAYLSLTIWSAMGLLWLIARLLLLIPRRGAIAYAAGAALCLIPLVDHFAAVDESGDYLVDDYTHNMFSSCQPGAVVFSYQWDYWVSSAYYYQLVDGERPDLVVIDKELLRRSWYLKELSVRYPWLIRQSQREVDAFLREVDKFERDQPYDPATIERRYAEMIASFISRNLPSHPVYVTGEVEPQYTRGYQRVPSGLAFRLYADTLFHREETPPFRYRPFARRGRLEDMVRTMYADAMTSRGEYYYYKRADASEAKKAFLSALGFDPSNPLPRRWLAALGSPQP